MRKRFDKELYEANDKLAKETLTGLLPNFDVRENPKKRDVDLLVYDKDGNHVANIETEIKRVWKGPDFKYDNVQFPERKAKYAKLDKPTVFVMFNEDLSKFLVVKDKDLLSSPCVEVPNKYVYKGEQFFQVPIDKVTFNDISSILKEIIDGK